MGTFGQAYLQDKERQLPYFYRLGAAGCIGSVTYERIRELFGSPEELFKADTDRLKSLGIFTEGQLLKLEKVKKDPKVMRDYEKALKTGVRILPFESEEYPANLKEIDDYAPVLFTKGNLPGPEVPCVSIIGARECSGYGAAVAKRLGELFAEKGIAVVSGMARGIDSLAQYAALSAGGYSLAFLGGGVDVIYPRESRHLYEILAERGGIVSELPPGTEPLRAYFARRNRLISGMSHVVCVVEAKEKSGTMITVNCALDQGREVWAVPGRINDITSFGTNELIRQGAGVINDLNVFTEEVVKRYGGAGQARTSAKNTVIDFLSSGERKIAEKLDENSFTAEQMSVRTGIPSFEVLGLCITLSEKGMVSSMGAGRFMASDRGIEVRNLILSEKGSEEGE